MPYGIKTTNATNATVLDTSGLIQIITLVSTTTFGALLGTPNVTLSYATTDTYGGIGATSFTVPRTLTYIIVTHVSMGYLSGNWSSTQPPTPPTGFGWPRIQSLNGTTTPSYRQLLDPNSYFVGGSFMRFYTLAAGTYTTDYLVYLPAFANVTLYTGAPGWRVQSGIIQIYKLGGP